LKRLLIAAFLAIPTIVVPATAAEAASRTGGCTPSGFISFQGLGTTYYHLASGYDVVDYFEYRIDGENGSTQNNVVISHRPGGFQYSSPDNRVDGRTYTYDPSVTVRTSASASTSTTYRFSFDRNNASDPECNATTPTW
jgi:hypothetical protein